MAASYGRCEHENIMQINTLNTRAADRVTQADEGADKGRGQRLNGRQIRCLNSRKSIEISIVVLYKACR